MAKIGLQLYSIKDEVEKDFFGTLKSVSGIGYDGVEFAGYYGLPAEKLASLMEEAGLISAATHITIENLENNLENEIEYAKNIYCSTIICPYLPDSYRNSEEACLKTTALFNVIGKSCKEAGILFLYHIHGYEFNQFAKRTIMDILLENTIPAYVSFEFDTYWIEAGGLESVDYYRKIGDRCPYIHIKDYNNKQEKHDVEVGTGVVNVKGLIEEANKKTADWVVVEQERFTLPPMESIRISFNNLSRLNIG